VIESSDTGQASTMFVGRDSFRMQVNDAGAVPATLWEGRTARVIDRRKNNRRQDRHVAPDLQEVESPAPPMPARNTIIGIALMTFACGVMVATAFNQFPMRGGSAIRTKTVLSFSTSTRSDRRNTTARCPGESSGRPPSPLTART